MRDPQHALCIRPLSPCNHTQAHTHSPCTGAHLFALVERGCPLTPHLLPPQLYAQGTRAGPPLTIHCMHTSMYARFSTSKFTRVSSGGPTARRGVRGLRAGAGHRAGGGALLLQEGQRHLVLVPSCWDEPASPTRPGPHSFPPCLSLSRLVLAPPPPVPLQQVGTSLIHPRPLILTLLPQRLP